MNNLKAIIEGRDYSSENDRIDAITRRNMKIKNFYGDTSEELKYDKDFETYCIVLAPHSNQPVKNCTVREYFALIKYANEKQKK